MKKLFPLFCFLFAGLVYVGCSDDIPTQASADQESTAIAERAFVPGGLLEARGGNGNKPDGEKGKKDCTADPLPRGCKDDDGDGGGGGDPGPDGPLMSATLIGGDLTDSDGAWRVGTGWDVGFHAEPVEGGGFTWDGFPAKAEGGTCDDATFRNLGAFMRKGKVHSVMLHGDMGEIELNSDRVALDEAQTPDDVNGWIMYVQKEFVFVTGKDKNKPKLCTVYVHDVKFLPVTL